MRRISRPLLLSILATGGIGLGFAAYVATTEPAPPPAAQEEADDLVVQLMQQPEQARREEGKVGGKDTAMKEARGSEVEVKKQELDRQIAETSGLLGSLSEGEVAGSLGSGSIDGNLSSGIGGPIGSRGTAMGSGGMAARGSGLGGGGTADSLGGMGVKGRGGGASGYGGGQAYGKLGSQGAPQDELPPGANSEDYRDYGVNEMILADADPLSTFSIDVDTASYTIARRKLEEGALPPAAAVRVEEFVNYFDYQYGPPRRGEPFAAHLEAAPSPWDPGHHLLRVGIQGRELAAAERKPARLTFLVDVSGSMSSGDKLELAKHSLRYLVENLGEEDSVSIVTYAGATEIVLGATPATQKEKILVAIDRLQSGGGTDMGSGVDLAYAQASAAFVRGAENRVVVVSDGDANIGDTSHEQILASVAGYAKEGISLSVIGFGMGNYKDALMEQFANKGDGNYYYIDSFAEARKVFGQDLAGTIQTIARDVKIQVEFHPQAVISYRLVGYENRDIADRDFRNDAVDAGEVGSGHQVTALYDVVLRDGYRDAGSLATVRLRAKPAGADAAAAEWKTAFPASAVREELADASADLRLLVGAAAFAEKLRGSRYVEEITYAQIAGMVAGARRRGVAAEEELERLVRVAGGLAGESGVARREGGALGHRRCGGAWWTERGLCCAAGVGACWTERGLCCAAGLEMGAVGESGRV